jgi:sugar O-acyltransferase (sialic acid O-acetyltransferase NeuD family)
MDQSRSRLLIWGAGGHGRVVADLVRACGHELLGFVDADPGKRDQVVEPGGARVVLSEQNLLRAVVEGALPEGIDGVALAIGDNRTRLQSLLQLGSLCVPTLVHPSAVVSPSARISRGSVVFPTAVINAGARLGHAVIVNSAAVVEHDCEVAEGAHISPHATLAGGVRVGARSWVGAGATVIQNVVVGTDAIVGAGSAVIRDVPDGATVVGVPARPVRPR